MRFRVKRVEIHFWDVEAESEEEAIELVQDSLDGRPPPGITAHPALRQATWGAWNLVPKSPVDP